MKISENVFFMRGSRGKRRRGTGPPPPPRVISKKKNKGFLSNTDPDPFKNHKATKPAFNVGPSSARQPNAIWMAFRWRADDGPLMVEFGSFFSSNYKKTKKKKTLSKLDPLWQYFLDPRLFLPTETISIAKWIVLCTNETRSNNSETIVKQKGQRLLELC